MKGRIVLISGMFFSLSSFADVYGPLDHLDALSYIVHNEIIDVEYDDLEDLLYGYDRDEYNRVRNNEFEKYDALDEFNSSIVANYSRDIEQRTYSAYFGDELGEYNMENEYFPIEGFGRGVSLLLRPPRSSWPHGWEIPGFFINAGEFDHFPLDRSVARDMIANRTRSNGYVDREISLYVEYQIAPYVESKNRYAQRYSLSDKAIFLEIVRFKVIDSDDQDRIYYDSLAVPN